MSSPRPVEPAPIVPRRGAAVRETWPGVRHDEPRAAALAGRQRHRERGAVRGVGEDVAEQRVTQAARSAAPSVTGSGPGAMSTVVARSVSSASTAQNATCSRTTAAASLPARPAPSPLPRLLDRLRHGSLQGVHTCPDLRGLLRVGQRLGVQAQCRERVRTRWARSATVSRSSRSSSAMRAVSPLTASAMMPSSAGAAGSARASSSPWASRCDTTARSVVERTSDLLARLHGRRGRGRVVEPGAGLVARRRAGAHARPVRDRRDRRGRAAELPGRVAVGTVEVDD
jgi:hypothetical protein